MKDCLLNEIKEEVLTCAKCVLRKDRHQAVLYRGGPDPKVVFVGEAPGKDEDLVGLPFVGRSGKVLDKWIAYLGLEKEDYAIVNVIKCRSRGPPEQWCVDACIDYMFRQLMIMEPKVVVALGGVAFKNLTHEAYGLHRTGKFWGGLLINAFQAKLYVMPHPAYCLRQGKIFYEKLNMLKVELDGV